MKHTLIHAAEAFGLAFLFVLATSRGNYDKAALFAALAAGVRAAASSLHGKGSQRPAEPPQPVPGS